MPGPDDDNDRDDLDVALEPEAPAEGVSLLDQLVQEREAAAAQQTEEFEIPNNGGLLWGTFRLLGWKRVKQFAEAVAASNSPTKELQVAAEMVAESCEGLWLRTRDGERIPWPGGGEDALPFGPALLARLRMDALPAAAKPRDYARVILAPPVPPEVGGEPRELAVTGFHQRLTEWMEEANRAVNREFAEG